MVVEVECAGRRVTERTPLERAGVVVRPVAAMPVIIIERHYNPNHPNGRRNTTGVPGPLDALSTGSPHGT